MTTLKEALKAAFREKGIKLPGASVVENKPTEERVDSKYLPENEKGKSEKNPKISYGKVSPRADSRPVHKPKPVTVPDSKRIAGSVASQAKGTVQRQPTKSIHPKQLPVENIDLPKPSWSIVLRDDSMVLLNEEESLPGSLIQMRKYDGIYPSICKDPSKNPIELTLGIDFGTSSTKVVVGDVQQDKAFAVPFMDLGNKDAYLLPGIVGFTDCYRLLHGDRAFKDLKLSLSNANEDSVFPVVAFLALVIRHTRAWLFNQHESLYKNSFIYWNLVVGTPSDGESENSISLAIQRIASAAWLVAGKEKLIDDNLIMSCLDVMLSDMDAVVSCCPEIAAQMYGFVSSESFDPSGNNIFMLVDVGAGTLDASVFYVSKNEDESWRFATYASSVEFNGSVNLHRERLRWLRDAIALTYPCRVDEIQSIESAMLKSDCLSKIPLSLNDYISGMTITFFDVGKNPDNQFKERVSSQVYGIYHSAWCEAGVPKHQLKELPTFYCGGGMRMPFYERIPTLFDQRLANYSWIHPTPRKLSMPNKLVAPGLHKSDYDRLSVAYGLALMGKGKHVTVNKVKPVDMAEPKGPSDYLLYPK